MRLTLLVPLLGDVNLSDEAQMAEITFGQLDVLRRLYAEAENQEERQYCIDKMIEQLQDFRGLQK